MKRILFLAGMLIIATSVFSQSRRSGDKNQVANSREQKAAVKQTPPSVESRRSSSSRSSNSDNVQRRTPSSNNESVTNRSSNSQNVNTSNSRRSSQGSSGSSTGTSTRRSSSSTVNRNDNPPSTYNNSRRSSTTQPRTSESNRRSGESGSVSHASGREYNTQQNRRGGNTASASRTPSHSNSIHNREVTQKHTSHYYHPNRYHRSVKTVYRSEPRPIEYRRVHHVYRAPVRVNLVWTPAMYREYRVMYPGMSWSYRTGYSIPTLSAYDAMYAVGDVRRIYGRVTEVFYAWENDEYILYFGPGFPYHDFSVVVPGHIAERYSRRPERFFTGANVAVTGLITAYDGRPEVLVRRSHQIERY